MHGHTVCHIIHTKQRERASHIGSLSVESSKNVIWSPMVLLHFNGGQNMKNICWELWLPRHWFNWVSVLHTLVHNWDIMWHTHFFTWYFCDIKRVYFVGKKIQCADLQMFNKHITIQNKINNETGNEWNETWALLAKSFARKKQNSSETPKAAYSTKSWYSW